MGLKGKNSNQTRKMTLLVNFCINHGEEMALDLPQLLWGRNLPHGWANILEFRERAMPQPTGSVYYGLESHLRRFRA